jgi:hypothetical protein
MAMETTLPKNKNKYASAPTAHDSIKTIITIGETYIKSKGVFRMGGTTESCIGR